MADVIRRSNCLFWALGQWRREGGYLALRRSRWGWFPHVLWTPALAPDAKSFVPIEPRRRLLPPLWFDGRVKQGD